MGEQYYAEVKIFPNTFAPYQWAYCDGQLMTIAQNPTLYSLLGTAFGGDGRANYGLPNLKGRTVVCQGKGPITQTRYFGIPFGEGQVQLTEDELPTHNHQMYAITEQSKESIADPEAYYSVAVDINKKACLQPTRNTQTARHSPRWMIKH
jgi:microcystin-dependent protein